MGPLFEKQLRLVGKTQIFKQPFFLMTKTDAEGMFFG